MADEGTILRIPTEAEKKDFKNIGMGTNFNLDKELRKIIDNEKAKYTLLYKPFCEQCAKVDIKKKVMAEKEEFIQQVHASSLHKGMSWDELAEKYINAIDEDKLKEYGETSHFKFTGEKPAHEMTLIGTTKINRLIGYHKDYQCVKRKYFNTSIFVPIEEYEKLKKIK